MQNRDLTKTEDYQFSLPRLIRLLLCLALRFLTGDSIDRFRFWLASSNTLPFVLLPVPIVRVTVETPSTNFVRKMTFALLNIPSCKIKYIFGSRVE